MNESVWSGLIWAAVLAGGAAAVMLGRLIPILVTWLDTRVMPPRHLKRCGQRRRVP